MYRAITPEDTAQTVFDHVATHLLRQNAKAKDNSSLCVYRTQTGLACAVGCLIPDGSPALTYGGPINGLLSEMPRLPEVAAMDRFYSLLLELQEIHDDNPPDVWGECLRNCADTHGLLYLETMQ